MATISAVIITYNQASNLVRCLDSLNTVADEIIVVDDYSSDRTEEICRNRNVVFYKNKFINFSNQKNYGNAKAKGDYILSIDSDECLSEPLRQSLLTIKKNMQAGGYKMNRLSNCKNKWIRTCGWYPDTKLRIWKRDNGIWEGEGVHERIKLKNDLSVVHLKGDILHYPYESVTHFLEKIQKYSSMYARDKRFKGSSSGFKIMYKTLFVFIKNYFFERGIFDGYRGLLIAFSNANHTFYKYAKLMEANKKLTISLIISTYNREEALDLVLLSALKQSEHPLEIIIADDGSNNFTKELVEAYQKKSLIPIVHCWQPDQGFRLSAIRNKAIAMAKGEYIVMIDGDIVMHKHFLRGHKKNAKIKQMIQGSRVFLSLGTTKKWITTKHLKVSLLSIIVSKNRFNSIHSSILSKLISSYTRNVTHVRGANMSFWKSDVLQINGFNENFVGWGREDSEFVVRMHNNGIACKRLKFMGFGYHLHHQLRSKEALQENEKLLRSTISLKLIKCEKGIDKYVLK